MNGSHLGAALRRAALGDVPGDGARLTEVLLCTLLHSPPKSTKVQLCTAAFTASAFTRGEISSELLNVRKLQSEERLLIQDSLRLGLSLFSDLQIPL